MEVFMTGFSYVNLTTQTAFGVARTHCSEEGRRALRAQRSVENGIPSDILDRIESWFQVMDFTGNINTALLLNERQYTQLEGFLFCLRRDLLGPNYLDHADKLNLAEFILTYISQDPLPAQIAHSRGLNGLIELAARFGREDLLERLLARTAEVRWGEVRRAVTWALFGAARGGHMAIVEGLFTRAEDAQEGVNWALQGAARGGHMAIVEGLFTRAEDAQEGVNWALHGAAKGGQGAIVEWLLTRPEAEGPRPDQGGVDNALFGAAEGGQGAIVERLLTRPEAEGPRPDQWSVNFALRVAARGGHRAIVERLLTRPGAE